MSSSPSPKKVAIMGATGRLGRKTLDLLLERKVPVKCLIRQSKAPDFLVQKQKKYSPELLEFVTNGDVTNKQSVQALLQDCSHCLALFGATRRSKWYEVFTAAEGSEDDDLSHAKQVNFEGIKTILSCAEESGTCKQIVRITGKGETPWSLFSVLINGLGSMAKGWNYEGEQVLRNNQQVDYTVIRPGIMKTDYDPQENNVHLELADNGHDLAVSPVSYDQIAELCVESLFYPEAKRTTLTAMNVANDDNQSSGSSSAKLSLADRLKKVKKDTRDFPKSLIQEHKRAVKTIFTSLAASFLAIFTGVMFKLFVR